MLESMPKANPRSIQELEAQKKAIKEAAAAEVAAIRKATAAKVAALKSNERRLRAMDIREQKKRDNHAKILVGVAMIYQCQTSDASAAKFKGMLEDFYADSPDRLKAALYGLAARCQETEQRPGTGLMRTFPKKCLTIGSIIFLISGLAALPYANAQATSSIPFVGCASDGQLGPRKAPHGKTKVLTLSPELASQLAYYQAQEGSGVLAPRGWRCFSTYGSNGGSLFVAPQLIDGKLMFSDKWKGFSGPVVQISDSFGGTSGRFEVASIIARVFPAHKAFVANVIAEGNADSSRLPIWPVPEGQTPLPQ